MKQQPHSFLRSRVMMIGLLGVVVLFSSLFFWRSEDRLRATLTLSAVDVNSDGQLTIDEVVPAVAWIKKHHGTDAPEFDINFDGRIDDADLEMLLDQAEKDCPSKLRAFYMLDTDQDLYISQEERDTFAWSALEAIENKNMEYDLNRNGMVTIQDVLIGTNTFTALKTRQY